LRAQRCSQRTHPWLPATAPRMVNVLITNKIQCNLSISRNVLSGFSVALIRNQRWRNSGSATNNIRVNTIQTNTMACIHQYVTLPNRPQRSQTAVT